MLHDGWIKAYRSIESWEWWDDGEMVRAFLSILFRCEPNSYKWHGIEMDAGSFVTTQEKLCGILKRSRQQVRTILSRLVRSGEIVIKSDNHHTVISVVNWSQYQGINQPITNQTQKINQPQQLEEQGLELDFEPCDNQQSTNQIPLCSQPITNQQKKEESTKEEIKIYKKQEEDFKPSCIPPYEVSDDLLGGQPQTDTKSKSRKFVKPTPEEVQKYCDERHNGINGQEFCDYYESNGWKVGRNPMKDWKAAVRTWEKYNRYSTHTTNAKPIDRSKKGF